VGTPVQFLSLFIAEIHSIHSWLPLGSSFWKPIPRTCLAYYYDHQVDLDAEIGRRREEVEALMAQAGESPLKKRLEEELQRGREAELRCELEEAMQDPLFLRDLQETAEAFQTADAETARLIPNG
jgi:hypothetical protein